MRQYSLIDSRSDRRTDAVPAPPRAKEANARARWLISRLSRLPYASRRCPTESVRVGKLMAGDGLIIKMKLPFARRPATHFVDWF